MGLIVPYEHESGYAVEIGKNAAEVDDIREKERTAAAVACLRLADEIEALEPLRAQRLRTVANDPNATRDQRWGAYKNDERAPRETQAPTQTRG